MVDADGYRIIESLRKKSSLGSTVCVPESFCIDIVLIDFRMLPIGTLVEHNASEFVERCVSGTLLSVKLYLRGFIGLLYLFVYSVSFMGFRILCMFRILMTFSLRKSRFGVG
jgi:hypothetical protein